MRDDTHTVAGVSADPANFLTPKDLQAELQIGERLAYRLLREGKIPSVRVGNLYRIPRLRLEETLAIHPALGKTA